MKLTQIYRDILQEALPKDKWVDLSKSQATDYEDDIFNLIKNAYAQIGGHPNFNSPSDISTGADLYQVIDLDDDPDIDAVSAAKNKSAGTKFVATGHDGTKPAKRAVVKHKIDLLKKPGYYIEVSGRIKDILLSAGVPVVTDKATIQKVLKGKQIRFLDDEGSYERELGGKWKEKILLGKPLST